MSRALILGLLVAWVGAAALIIWQTDPAALVTLQFSSIPALIWGLSGVALFVGAVIVLPARRPDPHPALEHIDEAVFLCRRDGVTVWANDPARALFPEGLPPTLREAASRTAKTRRLSMQSVEGEQGRIAVQIAPAGRRAVVICRPVHTDDFYDAFIHRIVHDMRNPLAGIVAHAANLNQPDELTPEVVRSATTIEAEARRLARLVDSMLFDARLAYVPLDVTRLDLADVLEEAIFTHDEQALQQGKSITLEAPPHRLPLTGDRDLLVRAFSNIIDNAVKYTQPGGAILVTVDEHGAEYRVAFSDDGVGIDAKYLPDRIFEPLVRGRARGAGSGLGLSIVKKIVTMHRGRITAASPPGEGTTITVTLPKEEPS